MKFIKADVKQNKTFINENKKMFTTTLVLIKIDAILRKKSILDYKSHAGGTVKNFPDLDRRLSMKPLQTASPVGA